MPRPTKGARLEFRPKRGYWYIRDGQTERGTGCLKADRAGAEAKLADYLAAKHEPDFGVGDPDQVSVVDVLTLYAKEHAPTTRRPDVIAGSVVALGEFWVGKVVGQITKRTCAQYVAWRSAQKDRRFKDTAKARNVGLQTVRRELEDLRAAINYAVGEHLLKYVVPVHMPEKAEPRDRWLTRDEAARLLWAAWKPYWRKSKPAGVSEEAWAEIRTRSRHLARFILVGLYTGTRRDAILRLRWMPSTDSGWVDLDRGLIFRKGSGEQQSSKRRTPVPISDRLLPHLRRWKRHSTTHVVEYDGLPIRVIRKSWVSAILAAGLGPEVVPHILRHTFATWAVQAGTPFGLVAGALGTSERIVQQVYGHHSPDYLRGVVNAVGTRRR